MLRSIQLLHREADLPELVLAVLRAVLTKITAPSQGDEWSYDQKERNGGQARGGTSGVDYYPASSQSSDIGPSTPQVAGGDQAERKPMNALRERARVHRGDL